MKITVELISPDVASATFMDLAKNLQSIAAGAEAEAPKKEPEAPKAEKPKAAKPKKEEPAKEPVKAEAPAEEPAPEPEKPKAEVINLEEMKKRVMAIKDKDADKWDSIKGLIKKYGNGKLSAIPEDDREEFMEAVEAL